MPVDCPDLEDIAALLDGKLTARERARLTEHLADCESCYEIFAGTAHILEDAREEQSQAATPRPFERPRQVRTLRPRAWWAAAALAAMLAATAGLVVYLQGARGAGPSTEQLASLVGPIAPLQDPFGKRMRGGTPTSDLPDLPSDREAFQLGVRFLDVRLALASGNEGKAEDALHRLRVLLERMPQPPPKTKAAYDELWNKVTRQGVAPSALLAAAAAAEKQAIEDLVEGAGLVERLRDGRLLPEGGVEEPKLVELGRWTEACRLAGENGRTDLFQEPATLRVLDEAMRPGGKDSDNLDPKALAISRTIRDDIAGRRIDPAALGARCKSLLELLANDDQ